MDSQWSTSMFSFWVHLYYHRTAKGRKMRIYEFFKTFLERMLEPLVTIQTARTCLHSTIARWIWHFTLDTTKLHNTSLPDSCLSSLKPPQIHPFRRSSVFHHRYSWMCDTVLAAFWSASTWSPARGCAVVAFSEPVVPHQWITKIVLSPRSSLATDFQRSLCK